MSHKITFYPIGNAETILLELSNDKTFIFNFADTHIDENEDKRFIHTDELCDKNQFDVAMLTHTHDDHNGSS